MASKLIAAQHTCKGLLKYILPNDMMTVDLAVMTLTGVHNYKKDKNNVENDFSLGVKRICLLQNFLRKVKETQRQRAEDFLGTLLNQDLEPNFWPKAPCTCPSFSKLTNSQEASRPGNSQEGHNIPLTVSLHQLE